MLTVFKDICYIPMSLRGWIYQVPIVVVAKSR